jgi:hypothetical protein
MTVGIGAATVPLKRFYERYVAACRDVGIVPLPMWQLVALLEAVAERTSAVLH